MHNLISTNGRADGHAPSRLAFALVLAALALIYAFLAGFHTTDFDTGWHLATGRYVIQHHAFPSTDQFSYTARGAEWIYPPFAGVIFYLLYSIAGWDILSWLTAAGCVAAVAFTLRRDEPITNALAIVAVPAIAYRTVARADLFNTILFAALLQVMWSYFRGRHARLWLFPVLMLLWTNLPLGFVAGLGMLAAYAGMELLELPFPDHRAPAIGRLKRAWPWLCASFAVTLVNPFGPRLYRGVLEQPLLTKGWNYLVGEFASTPLSTARQAFQWRDPGTSYWWLMAIAAAAIVIALARKQLGTAVLLAGAAYMSLSRARFQGMLALTVVIVAGAVLTDFARTLLEGNHRINSKPLAIAVVSVLAIFVGIRGTDLITERTYIVAAETTLFGAGPSWWYPDRAAGFVRSEHLPGNIFNDFNSGAFLTWKLGPDYPVYSDNRAIPFGIGLLFHQDGLIRQPPDSAAWQQEADRYGINTMLVSVARYAGLGSFPLQAFCTSRNWRPVYLDDVAAVFVRNLPENAALIQRLKIDCATIPFTAHVPSRGWRGKAETFQFDANSAAVLYVLGRDQEAFAALNRAQELFPDDAGVSLGKGQLFQAHMQLSEAEQEYRTALRQKQTSIGWYALGMLLASEGRWNEASAALGHAANLSVYPHGTYLQLGNICLGASQPRQALEAFELARRSSPFKDEAAPFGGQFAAEVADGQARAWTMLSDANMAATFTQQAREARQLAQESYAHWDGH
jgi:tetratricopeptide (TPR) repeat protein